MSQAIGLPEYQRRRARLMNLMGANTVAFVPGAETGYRNRDVELPFRQNSDFLYLTGLAAPGCLLVLAPGRKEGETVLFCPRRNEREERYRGPQLGPERAAAALLVDEALPSGDVADALPTLLSGRTRVYATLGERPALDRLLIENVAQLRLREASGVAAPDEFVSLSRLLHEERLFKSPAERRLMAQAADITVAAHIRAMRRCAPGMTERHLEAELMHEFAAGGAAAAAYPPIVASGANACVMHYTNNAAPLLDGDLVLIDAGCEYAGYAADVTRTFPVNGRFSAQQKDVYAIVLEAQRTALAAAKAGASFDAPQQAATRSLTKGLIDLGILAGDLDAALERNAAERYAVHRCSHWLGMDVHDVGRYRIDAAWRALAPGMALTIEPGLYFPDGEDIPAAWRGIGVRIEDDVIVQAEDTHDGAALVLSADAPKAVDDIEALMRG